MKTKYATEAAEALKKMVNYKQPQKVWFDDGTEFLAAFKNLSDKRGNHLYSNFSEKVCFCRTEHLVTEKYHLYIS